MILASKKADGKFHWPASILLKTLMEGVRYRGWRDPWGKATVEDTVLFRLDALSPVSSLEEARQGFLI